MNHPALDLIEFFSEQVVFELPNADVVRLWIYETIQSEKQELTGINFIFCSDEYLYQMNMEYLQHDTYTDVITFPYSETAVEGDIFISLDRVNDNAFYLKVGKMHELHRVIIHGVLHLLGYRDGTDQEEKQMRERENHYLAKFPLPLN